MTSYRLLSIGCCSLLIATVSYWLKISSQIPIPNQNANGESKIDRQLSEHIKKIVVKVNADNSSGSGIIIQKTNNIYTVITNRHVVDRGDKYQILTDDCLLHLGRLSNVSKQDDLAILEFTSDRIYPISKINSAPLKTSDFLLSAGFPFNSDRLQITSGQLLLKTHKPLKQGYQLGYTNVIHEGMSGGAIVNFAGEVVGINGRSANPILPDYQYQDLSYPTKHLQQRMTQLSWGIPIIKAIELINEQ